MDDRRDALDDRSGGRGTDRLSVRIEHDGTTSTVHLVGELDLSSADALGHELGQLGDNGTLRVEIDATGLRFVDSAGLHVLLDARRQVLDRGGSLVIGDRSPALQRLLEVCGLTEAFVGGHHD